MIPELLSYYDAHQHISRIAIATLIGAGIGLEREIRGKAAGIRTFALVALSSCLFTIISELAGADEPTRIASNIITGIGFLAGSVIWHKDSGMIDGLTTSASLWGVSALAMAIGFGYISLAVASAGIILVVMEFFGLVALLVKKAFKLKVEK